MQRIFDWTVDIKTVILIVGFLSTAAGAWYDVKSDARNLETRVVNHLTADQLLEDQASRQREDLKLQLQQTRDEIRQDIRELRRELTGRDQRDRSTATQQPERQSPVRSQVGSREHS